jgi:cytochrome b561
MTTSTRPLDRPRRGAFSAADAPRYSGVMQAMHWVTVALLCCAYPVAWMIDSAISQPEAARLLMLHRSFGVAILLMTILRLGIRRQARIPPLPADLPAIQRVAARASAALLYALLIVQPLLGFAASLLHGDHVVLFGNLELPVRVTVDKPLAHRLFELHGWIALALLGLIGLHAAAALHHHFVRKDSVLAGMLPGRRPATVSRQ